MPTRSGTCIAQDGEPQSLSLRQREPAAREPGTVPGEQAAHDLPGLADRRHRIRLIQAERLQPGPSRQPEESAPVRGRVERRDLAGDLNRVDGERIEA